MKTKEQIGQTICNDIGLKAKEVLNNNAYKNASEDKILLDASIEVLVGLVADLMYDKQNNKGETNEN